MNLKKIASEIKNSLEKKNVVVVVQCRLSSSRLPRKALLNLGGKPVLEWTLSALKKVKASKYFLAVDGESADELFPVAKKCGWNFFSGSKEDVLARFCGVISESKADVVLRGTADNPFLFFDAAQDLLDEFLRKSRETKIDYMTFSGLPHGSGVEVFDARSLLKAAAETSLPYDHEHVGPALYNHREKFNCIFLKAPAKYNFPDFRTTVDTQADFIRAQKIVKKISENPKAKMPYSTEEILSALKTPGIKNPVLLFPSVKKGQGTGHLRRCISIAIKNNWDIYIDKEADLTQRQEVLAEAGKNGLEKFQIVENLSCLDSYALAVTDLFSAEKKFAESLAEKIPVLAMDDGSSDSEIFEYVLDILPSAEKKRCVNLAEPGFIPLPKNRRNKNENRIIKKAAVTLGGEDPKKLSLKAAAALAENGISVTLILPSAESRTECEKKIPRGLEKNISVILPVENLREKLFEFDLVVTHYGFTSFEALKAGCFVLLLGTSGLHEKLSASFGFECVRPEKISAENFKKILMHTEKLSPSFGAEEKSVSDFLLKISGGKHFDCPVCKKIGGHKNKIVARTKFRTFRRCAECGMIYISWTSAEKETEYNRSYFFEDYAKQYGKTYLEDFDSIKQNCVRRISTIDFLYRISNRNLKGTGMPSVLDVGCAMGPFLDAANDFGWQVFGSDVSKVAVEYVQKKLNFPAVLAKFPDCDVETEFGMEKFDAVTMWFVIEHFENLDSVLKKISSIVKDGGIFAFGTPSASGISGKFSTQKFFDESPADHFSVWEIPRARSILKRYGFSVMKIVSTGIHPERLPAVKKLKIKPDGTLMKILRKVTENLKLGDTFEIYCRKIKN